MSGQSSGAGLFSRKRGSSDEPPADDPVKAPYGWMKDKSTGKWRPRKSWGGAGRDGRKVGGRTGGATTPDRPAGKPTARKKTAKKPAAKRADTLRMVDPIVHEALEEAMDEVEANAIPWLGADPAPSWHLDPEPAPPEPSGEVDMRTEVESWIALGWSLPADALATMDPYCFGPLVDEQTGPLIVSCFTDIAMQSPKVAAFIASKSGLMPYIKLGFAFKPVLQNAWQHHISKKVEVDIDRETMTYTVNKRDYSQYPAA